MKTCLTIFLLLIFPVTAFLQEVECTVIDSLSNQPLEGANILHIATGHGTVSDKRGHFRLDLQNSSGSILVSYLGYREKIVPVKSLLSDPKPTIEMQALSHTTPEITIRATGERKPYDVPARIEVITLEELKNNPASGIDLMLNYVPGVTVTRDFGIFSDKAVVSLRGMGGDSQKRTLVCLDGLPLNKSDGGSINWNLVNLSDYERIDILKGPASAMFGNNAMGGVINLISASGKKEKHSKIETGYGSYNTRWAGANYGNSATFKNNGVLSYTVAAKYRDSDGYIVEPDETIEEYDSIVVPLFLKEWGAAAKIAYTQKQQSLSVSLDYFDDNRGRGIRVFESLGANSSHQTRRAALHYSYKKGGNEVRLQAFDQRENYLRNNEYLHDGEYKLYDVDAQRTDRGLASMVDLRRIKGHTITAGLSLNSGNTDAVDLYFTSTDKITNAGDLSSLGSFVQDRFLFFNEHLELYAGLRFDGARFKNGRFGIENPSYSIIYLQDFATPDFATKQWQAISPKLALQYSIPEKISAYLSWGRGFSAPLLDDLCRTGMKSNEFQLANPGLGAETIDNAELGFTWDVVPKIDLSCSMYSSTGRDFMYSVNTGDSVNLGYKIVPVKQVQNISEVLIEGAEVSLSYQAFRQLSFNFSYAQSDSKIRKFAPGDSLQQRDLTGKHLAEVPDKNYSCKIIWKHRHVQATVQAKYTGERWINELNSIEQLYLNARKYPAYLLVDAQVSARFFEQLTVRFKLENMFDEIYINSKGQRNPGRFVTLGAEWDIFK